MPRRVQDIVQRDRRSIRDIDLEKQQKAAANKRPRESDARDDSDSFRPAITRARISKDDEPVGESQPPEEMPISREKSMLRRMPITPPPDAPSRPRVSSGRLKRLIIAVVIIVGIGAIGFVASSRYSHASFTIVPKVIPVAVNGTYVAQATPAQDALSYVVVTLKGNASTTVPAIDGAPTSIKAAGTVMLHNSYSAQPVRLIAGTRLSNDAGNIYRLTGSVVIPGMTTAGGSTIPGTVSVQVAADQPGAQYNIAKNDTFASFKIVAYKGSPKYDSIYASATTDIAGGFIGTKKTISPAIAASTTARLQSLITSSLQSQLAAVVPDGYIMYPSNYATSWDLPVIGDNSPSLASFSLQGTLYGILFKKSELAAKFSANQSNTGFGTTGYTSPGLESLNVIITNIKDFSPDKKNSLVIHASGSFKLVGAVPIDEIRQKLEGQPLSATEDILRSYSPAIESGSGELVPPWARIPTDPSRIAITIQNP
ncbi:MAG: hypothetical protein KGI59_01310 [Patescibacteria group bacterium]|nr:hypothetical protein [Patescibacteria group bacterium]MDE2172856.1 hypothetical protein [Patescibacteria group bacterium]